MRSSAATGSRGTQSDAASPFPDPAGTSPGDGEPTSAEPTSLTVPSPPHTTTRSAPLTAARRAHAHDRLARDVDRSPSPRRARTSRTSPDA